MPPGQGDPAGAGLGAEGPRGPWQPQALCGSVKHYCMLHYMQSLKITSEIPRCEKTPGWLPLSNYSHPSTS